MKKIIIVMALSASLTPALASQTRNYEQDWAICKGRAAAQSAQGLGASFAFQGLIGMAMQSSREDVIARGCMAELGYRTQPQ